MDRLRVRGVQRRPRPGQPHRRHDAGAVRAIKAQAIWCAAGGRHARRRPRCRCECANQHPPIDALQVECVRADAPHHRRVVSGVLSVGWAAIKWHSADAAYVVACGDARMTWVRAQPGARPTTRLRTVLWTAGGMSGSGLGRGNYAAGRPGAIFAPAVRGGQILPQPAKEAWHAAPCGCSKPTCVPCPAGYGVPFLYLYIKSHSRLQRPAGSARQHRPCNTCGRKVGEGGAAAELAQGSSERQAATGGTFIGLQTPVHAAWKQRQPYRGGGCSADQSNQSLFRLPTRFDGL